MGIYSNCRIYLFIEQSGAMKRFSGFLNAIRSKQVFKAQFLKMLGLNESSLWAEELTFLDFKTEFSIKEVSRGPNDLVRRLTKPCKGPQKSMGTIDTSNATESGPEKIKISHNAHFIHKRKTLKLIDIRV